MQKTVCIGDPVTAGIFSERNRKRVSSMLQSTVRHLTLLAIRIGVVGGGGFLDLGLLDDGPFLRTTASARASEVTSQVSRLESALKNKSLL